MHRGHGIEEAGREPTEASVSQARIRFLLDQFKPVDTFFLDRFLYYGIKQQVRNVVGQRTSEEKFHRKVVNAFGILLLIGLLGLDPALRQDVAHRA